MIDGKGISTMKKEMMLTLDQLEEITGGAFDTPEEKQILDACLMRVSQRIDEGILPKEAMVELGHVITEYTKKIRDTGPPVVPRGVRSM